MTEKSEYASWNIEDLDAAVRIAGAELREMRLALVEAKHARTQQWINDNKEGA